MFNGTGANVVGLQSMLPAGARSIAARRRTSTSTRAARPSESPGIKMLTVADADGKLTPELIDREAWGWGDEHRAQPLVVSITQSTELGTLYTVDEMRAIADHAHERGMRVHMDGARISNAAAALGLPLRAFTQRRRRRRLSFGGTKNGAMLGGRRSSCSNAEAADGLIYLRKLNMQLASKMRFVSAQLIALLERRPVAAQRAARERDGRAAALRVSRPESPTARSAESSSPSRRRRTACSRRCPRCRGPAARALPLLRLGRREERGALDVQLRHHRRDIDAFVAAIARLTGRHRRPQ